MYLFQISNYNDPAVDRETAELLHRHLEAESRRRCPVMWNAIDRIRTHAAKGPARERRTVRYRIYGVFLLALGLLTLILGLMPPRTTDVIIVGGAVIIAGLLEFALARGRTPPRIPASCKKEARKALELRRAVDWEKHIFSQSELSELLHGSIKSDTIVPLGSLGKEIIGLFHT